MGALFSCHQHSWRLVWGYRPSPSAAGTTHTRGREKRREEGNLKSQPIENFISFLVYISIAYSFAIQNTCFRSRHRHSAVFCSICLVILCVPNKERWSFCCWVFWVPVVLTIFWVFTRWHRKRWNDCCI